MNIDKLNQWLTLLANIGVLAGIVFLALELQQNSQLMQAQTRDSITEKSLFFNDSLYGDANAFDVWESNTLESDFSAPIAAEKLRFLFMVNSNFRLWENEWYQYQNGLFEQSEFEPRLTFWSTLLSLPAYRAIWELTKNTFAPNFRQQIDRMIRESGSTPRQTE